MTKLVKFVKDESGATAIEYGLIAAAIGLVLAASADTLATAITGKFGEVEAELNNAGGAGG